MKHLPVAGKLITLLFTAAFLVACSGADTKPSETGNTTADLDAKDAQIAAEQEAKAKAIKLIRLTDVATAAGNVFYFEYDSATLTSQALTALDAHIALLKASERNVRLEGHTDERGTREYNLALGERRANAVRDYMGANGIAGYLIETVSYGEEQPVAIGSTESDWSQNRRVELK